MITAEERAYALHLDSDELYEFVVHVGDGTPVCGITDRSWKAEGRMVEGLFAQAADSRAWGEVFAIERDYRTLTTTYQRTARIWVCHVDADEPGVLRWS